MQLTPSQKTTLKAHMAANTNVTPTPGADGQTFVVNTRYLNGNATDQQAIADWYNTVATGTENQPFSNLDVWVPVVTIAALNSAIKWQTAPVGATAADVTNSWLLFQSMIWNMQIDMSDGSVRKGILQVFGDVAGGSAANIGAVGCGMAVGTRVALALSPAATGAATNAWGNAHVVPKGQNGGTLYGQTLTQPDVADLTLNG